MKMLNILKKLKEYENTEHRVLVRRSSMSMMFDVERTFLHEEAFVHEVHGVLLDGDLYSSILLVQ